MKEKRVYISGGSRGIGFECAKKYIKEGYTVGIGYSGLRNMPEPKDFGLSDSDNLYLFKADLNDESQIITFVKDYIKIIGVPDVLVLCAGVAHQGLFQYTSTETYDRIMNVNVKANYLIIREFLPYMINNKSGSIVTVASILGEVGASCEAVYSASKAAIIGMTKALSKELAPSGIRVNCISPGVIKTDMISTLDSETISSLIEDTPIGRLGTPRDVAEAIYWVSSEEASFITGQVISVNGGIIL